MARDRNGLFDNVKLNCFSLLFTKNKKVTIGTRNYAVRLL